MNLSVLQHCPDCGRVLYFSHEETTLIQCACGSTIARQNNQLTAKPVFTISQPSDPIQPGTEGAWNGKTFRVLGRIRAWIEEFVFNYWTITWQDGTLGYLGEGYGLYAVYELITIDQALSTSWLDILKVGAKKDLFRQDVFVLERKYECYKWELEGEAWLPQVPASFRTFEFAALDGRRLEMIALGKELILCFHVYYAVLSDLQLNNTRDAEPPKKTLSCKKCLQENTVKGFPYSQSYACIHCGSRYGLERGGDFKLLGKKNSTDIGPDIELGATGLLRSINYEVIGYALKEEANQYRSQWKEYTLYHHQQGFAFLSEYNGHWIFTRERGDAPVLENEYKNSLLFEGEPFELYNSYSFEVVNARGAFPYHAFNDDDKKVKEFISPPEVWIQEKSGREGIIWFIGQHLPAGEVKSAFGEQVVIPQKTGIGAVEPKGYVNFDKIWKAVAMVILLLIVVHLATSLTHRNQVISENTYEFRDSVDTVAYIKKNIVLDKWQSNLEFEIIADVNNSWCEVSATLVDVSKGTEYSFEQGVEYYFGYSDGEKWTEGSRNETAFLSKIPAGTYDLIIRGLREKSIAFQAYTGGAPAYNPTVSSFQMRVIYDTTNHRNLFFCMIPLVLWSFGHYLLIRNNERRRWYNSPFSPYTYSNED